MYDSLKMNRLPTGLVVALCASLTLSAAQNPVPTPPATQTPAAAPAPAPNPQTWTDWLASVRTEALSRGISQATVDAALTNLEQMPVAVERDRSQPETILTLDAYLDQHLTTKVIKSARAAATEHSALLKRVTKKYGVDEALLVAVWGLESNFGQFVGSRPIIAALATLAYDGRRALFRNELFDALTILDQRHMAPEDLKGSWAGAMGQPQFMPSSYLKYAVDFDDDGRADIWKSSADVFASIANYLKEHGWTNGERWGREVRVSEEVMARVDAEVPLRSAGCKAVRELTETRPLKELKKLGVLLEDGKPLPSSEITASLLRGDKRRFLVYDNYNAILEYNCANSYAVSVGLLADEIDLRNR